MSTYNRLYDSHICNIRSQPIPDQITPAQGLVAKHGPEMFPDASETVSGKGKGSSGTPGTPSPKSAGWSHQLRPTKVEVETAENGDGIIFDGIFQWDVDISYQQYDLLGTWRIGDTQLIPSWIGNVVTMWLWRSLCSYKTTSLLGGSSHFLSKCMM